MAKVIIFDCMGVLTQNSDLGTYISSLAPPEKREKIKEYVSALWNGSKGGGMYTKYFWEILGELLNKEPNELEADVKKYVGVNKDMVAWLKELSADYRIVIMSNHLRGWFEEFLRQNELEPYCEFISVSYDSPHHKPDPKAYEDVLSLLNCQASDVVLIDDTPINIKSAKSLGIQTILFASYTQTKTEFSLM